jgi:hypothetical protein
MLRRIRDKSSGALGRREVGKVNLAESVPTAAPIAQLGMNQVREYFHTIDDARAGPGALSVSVLGEDAVI